MSAILAYREQAARDRRITTPNLVKPETAHPAFDKGCHLFGLEMRNAPIDPATTKVDMDALRALVDEDTIAVVGSACNYGYGTIDPISELSDLALERGIGLHVDGCLGGYILPWGEELGYDIEPFDFRVPGVTSISADTHKYGYGFKGTSTLLFRSNDLRRGLYFFQTGWTGGKYMSPGIAGSRSNGLLAATWASMVTMGRDGYRKKAKAIFETADAMKEAVRSHAELRIIGDPTFCFSFTSDAFDIYLVNDHLRSKGWRLNGQQYPNAVHMAVTGPQTQPGLVEVWRADLADAVAYAIEHKDETPHTGSIYGGIPGGPTPEATEFIEDMMSMLLDRMQSVPES
jgi:glutamate/tyrosine decarboxylase-like PLP-dependent enzyme